MAVVTSPVPVDLALSDDAVDGSEIRMAWRILNLFIGTQSCDNFDLPKTLSCKSRGIGYRYSRPDDISYVLERLVDQKDDEVGVDFTTAGRRLRLLFQVKDGSIVLKTVEHSPHPNLKCQ